MKRGVPLYLQIILALVAGLLAGPLLGSHAGGLGAIGSLVVQLIKAAATPLLFFAIVHAILQTDVRGRAALRLMGWALLNASIALTVGLVLSNVIRPGRALQGLASAVEPSGAYAGRQLDVLATLATFVPTSVVTPFAENLVLSVILLAVLAGFGFRAVRAEQVAAGGDGYRTVERLVATLLRMTEVVLGWIIRLVPLAVFAVVTAAVGEHGLAPARGLALYVAVGVGGMALHVLLTYQAWLVLFTRIPIRRFWQEAREPALYAAGTNSSLATLPVTLRALDRLGVSRGSSTLGACVGTNFNNDGILLYEGMAVLFVAQASGIDLSIGQQLVAAGVSLVAAMGVAGVPEAGFVSLAIVLGTVGLPVEWLPLLLSVDWIVARARSVNNVLSDMVLSILVDRRGGAEASTA